MTETTTSPLTTLTVEDFRTGGNPNLTPEEQFNNYVADIAYFEGPRR